MNLVHSCDDNTCIETLYYNIAITDEGEADVDLTALEFNLNGYASDVLQQLSEVALTPLNSTGLQILVEAFICEADEFVAVAAVEAIPSNGLTVICEASDKHAFIAPALLAPLLPDPPSTGTPQSSPIVEAPAPNVASAPIPVPSAPIAMTTPDEIPQRRKWRRKGQRRYYTKKVIPFQHSFDNVVAQSAPNIIVYLVVSLPGIVFSYHASLHGFLTDLKSSF